MRENPIIKKDTCRDQRLEKAKIKKGPFNFHPKCLIKKCGHVRAREEEIKKGEVAMVLGGGFGTKTDTEDVKHPGGGGVMKGGGGKEKSLTLPQKKGLEKSLLTEKKSMIRRVKTKILRVKKVYLA